MPLAAEGWPILIVHQSQNFRIDGPKNSYDRVLLVLLDFCQLLPPVATVLLFCGSPHHQPREPGTSRARMIDAAKPRNVGPR